ncbi:MAG: DNA ligase D [Deltaproteobacteria bacterium]|nr:DNA ligase D [Deltaproteobacteria bacterium]
MSRANHDLRLAAYRGKRAAGRTPEPFAPPAATIGAGPLRFAVHLHDARMLHYDLRLEIGGVLASWALPKGPAADPAEKRFAAHVEDHPLAYGDFEGVIPDGNYGAGASILWDRGRFEPHSDPAAGVTLGKLLFTLHGYKLKGLWTLVRTGGKRGTGKDWLLIKKPDAFAPPDLDRMSYPAPSVLSGLTIEERARATTLARDLAAEARALGATPRPIALDALLPMLAETAAAPFSRAGWLFEPKYDGFRLLASRDPEVRLRYRRGGDATHLFPEVALALSTLPYRLVMDGEIVVTDATGRPSFELLAERAHQTRAADIAALSVLHPATYFVFDLPALEGFDLGDLPLATRKALLARVAPALGPVRFVAHVETRGRELYDAATRLGLEGIVAKRADSPYRPGRQKTWLKVRALTTADFVVVGYAKPGRGLVGARALHLGAYVDGALVWCGKVGTGMTERDREALLERLRADVRARPACRAVGAVSRADVWVTPRFACEVRYAERTADGCLRHPVFLRVRDDKPLADCSLDPRTGDAPPAPPRPEPEVKVVPYTHLDKVFWPAEGYSKGDLIAYYQDVAPELLPYLSDRPVVLTRYPDGIDGKSFFQKDAPTYVPSWIRTERLWSGDTERDINYFVCDDATALAYLANLGTIPLHIWSSRVATLAAPDWCILDLDPKGAPFADVVTLARALYELATTVGLPSYPKTSGQSGLHVLIPLGRRCTYEQGRALAEILAREVERRHPDIATTTRPLAARRGRVYLDYGQNGHGRLLVAPFAVRPIPGAPVSMPLTWREVGPKLDPAAFTIRTSRRRLDKLGDPLRPVLTEEPDLVAALERLAARLPG